MNTVDVVRECQVKVSGDLDQHRVRVGMVIGVHHVARGNRVEMARELGCALFVGKQQTFKRFKYHAGIKGGYTKQPNIVARLLAGLLVIPNQSKAVDYVGDIPETVLNNIERLPEGSKLTVHSMYPLPTKEYFKQVDPVMIWWLDDEIGAVVGVWDNDKEMEL